MARRIFLNPGELHFGSGDVRIETLLGSCVTITLRHQSRSVGGMCHYLLPSRLGNPHAAPTVLPFDPRYGDEAMAFLMRQLASAKISLGECHASVYGGANVIDFGPTGRPTVGQSNASFALQCLETLGIAVATVDVGGNHYRYLSFDLATGEMHVRHGDPEAVKARAAGKSGTMTHEKNRRN